MKLLESKESITKVPKAWSLAPMMYFCCKSIRAKLAEKKIPTANSKHPDQVGGQCGDFLRKATQSDQNSGSESWHMSINLKSLLNWDQLDLVID